MGCCGFEECFLHSACPLAWTGSEWQDCMGDCGIDRRAQQAVRVSQIRSASQ